MPYLPDLVMELHLFTFVRPPVCPSIIPILEYRGGSEATVVSVDRCLAYRARPCRGVSWDDRSVVQNLLAAWRASVARRRAEGDPVVWLVFVGRIVVAPRPSRAWCATGFPQGCRARS